MNQSATLPMLSLAGNKQANNTAYGSVDAFMAAEYDGPYGVLLGERYTVIQSIATDGANHCVASVVERRG